MQRILRLCAALLLLGSLSACAVYPATTIAYRPVPHAHWVPGHFGAYGAWHLGHWA